MSHLSSNSKNAILTLALISVTGLPVGDLSGQSPMFRGDPAHSGTAPGRGVETLGGIAWRFETAGTVRSTPALVGGVLYFGSADGHLYAVAAEDGTQLWSFDAGNSINSSPAATDELVLFTDRSNTIWALDQATGLPRWQLETGPDLPLAWGYEGWDYLGASPVIVPGADGPVALVGSGNGILYALMAETGELLWSVDTGARIRATPAVADGRVYLGNGAGVFSSYDVETGENIWNFETSGVGYDAADFGFDRRQIQGSAAVAGGTVYFGSRDASLYALDSRTGAVRWHLEDGSAWVVNSPAVRPDVVVNGRSSSTNLRALDPETGAERWVVETGGAVFSSPLLVGTTAYVGTGSGRVHAFDVADGRELWSFRTGGGIYGSPVAADGRLYVGSDDGSLYALAAGAVAPIRAVYYDSTMMDRSNWGSDIDHRRATEYFERYGYTVLDLPALTSFLANRAEDRIPSVVVFGMDAIPLEWNDGYGSSPWHDYLAAGGKIVWLGHPPLLIVRDSSGYSVERERAAGFTGVDPAGWNGDQYSSSPTAAGRTWGLSAWRVENPSAFPDAVDLVLRQTENGTASVWVRSYGGPHGTGLVVIPASTDRDELDEIRRVAEFGVMDRRAAMK